MKKYLLAILMVFILVTPCFSATYYVAKNGNDAGNSGSEESPWLTIQKCANTARAGDICYIKAGTYSETITVAASGSSGNTITFVADGTVTTNGWIVTGDYIRIIGFVVEGNNSRLRGIAIANADYCEIWHNTVQNFVYDSILTDNGSKRYQANNCLFIGNVSINSGSKDFQVRGNHNIVAYNESDSARQDFIYIFGGYNRILNNYSHDINAAAHSHTDFLQTGQDSALGLHDGLYEANLYLDVAGTHHHGSNMETNNASNDANHVLRRNVWNGHGSYVYGFSGGSYHYRKIYNEHVIICQASHPNYNYANYSRGNYPSYFNNIFYQAWGTSTTRASIDDSTSWGHTSDYNLYYDTGGNISYSSTINFESNSILNDSPEITNIGKADFTISSTSPCRGAGGPLTLTNGNGTGTTFNVDDATFFRGDDTTINQYGGNLVIGDIITVGSDIVQIRNISGNAITVTESFTWGNNEPVYWGKDTTPDIGALPYKTSYALTATYSRSGGTVTVTPSDSDLVRYAIVFEDGIPVGVDSASPFSVSGVGSGTLKVRVYPKYASSSLVVTAIESSGNGSPAVPVGVKIKK